MGINRRPSPSAPRDENPLWYKDAIIYEVRIRSFFDMNADGIGDIKGLTEKLDYIQDLGVTAIWLLPFYPSPMRDDGYDISDYTAVHQEVGNISDFRVFLREAHARGINVITELVLNHTSDQHPWFVRARRLLKGDPRRDFYIWNDNHERYREARIIFKDFEPSNWTWDPDAWAYYWHRFYSHQPDLNYDNPTVRKEIIDVVDYWLNLGVDGLRLDAVPYLYERDGTNCENLPETHQFLKDLRAHVDAKFKNRMLLAEANQWPEEAAAYLAQGKECHMAFHFPMMPRIFMAVQMENRFPLVDIISQTPQIEESCQWALFLRNHDELTLEMVTDEERDYMYKVYGSDPHTRVNLGIRRRLAPLLGNNRRKIELLNGLLFALPGTPVVYYGDEIGMGDNIYLKDRSGVRTPMQWSADRNAGFSKGNPQRLILPVNIDPEYHYETVNVEANQNNPSSLLWWMKRIISIRKRYKALGRGTIRFLHPRNRKVLVFIRQWQDEIIMVVSNLSRTAQYVEIDLAEFRGMVAIELFGQNQFPQIGDLPYFITLGPYQFYWFAIQPRPEAEEISSAVRKLPSISARGAWKGILEGEVRTAFERALPGILRTREWFPIKLRAIESARIVEFVPVTQKACMAVIRVQFVDSTVDEYAMHIALAWGERAEQLLKWQPQWVLANIRAKEDGKDVEGVLCEAIGDEEFTSTLLDAVGKRRRLEGEMGSIVGVPTKAFTEKAPESESQAAPRVPKLKRDISSVIYGDNLRLRLYHRLEDGIHPGLEIGNFLTEHTSFDQIAAVAGYLEHRRESTEPVTFGLLEHLVPNEGPASEYVTDEVNDFFERVLLRREPMEDGPGAGKSILSLSGEPFPEEYAVLVGPFLDVAALLGARTAQMHKALSSDQVDPVFRPEPFTMLYQRSLYQSMRNVSGEALQRLANRLSEIPEKVRKLAEEVTKNEKEIFEIYHFLLNEKVTPMRIRCHGNFELSHLLYTGKDFVIIDFEGHTGSSFSERRIKRCALRDIAAMIISLEYVVSLALSGQWSTARPEDVGFLEGWGRFWHRWVSASFLKAYMSEASGAPFIPASVKETESLIRIYKLERAVSDLVAEMERNWERAEIPLRVILRVLGKEA